MPENTISITRPHEYGNPFRVGGYFKIGHGGNGFAWLQCGQGPQEATRQGFTLIKTKAQAVEWYRLYRERYPLMSGEIAKLRGKNLACFCKLCVAHADGKPLDVMCDKCEPCHVDILGPAANAS